MLPGTGAEPAQSEPLESPGHDGGSRGHAR
jgi:hypothetical protein